MSTRRAFIGLGSNLGSELGGRLAHLEAAARHLSQLGKGLRVSPIVRTPALVPAGAPDSWRQFFLNAVAELEWAGSAHELLAALKKIEAELGRQVAPRWAPRVIDLDLLALGEEIAEGEGLRVPHPEAASRSFVLDPWKELAPEFRVPGLGQNIRELSLALPARAPLWMGILNLTPDSFSDGGHLAASGALEAKLARWEESFVQAIDLGAESTRPGARPIAPEEEWARLAPALSHLRERYRGRFFRPLVSVDTRHAATAERALEMGADLLNDVSGGADPAMLTLARHAPRGIVLMHSLSVPADPTLTLDPACDPVRELRAWAELALERAARAGLPAEKLILDPGLGFGKTAAQSLELTRRFGELSELPTRWLVGHSRKSFLQSFGARAVGEREGFSLGVSMHLARAGVAWLRVHEAGLHKDALDAARELAP